MFSSGSTIGPEDTGWGSSSHDRPFVGLGEIAAVLKRSLWVVVACPLIAVALATFYVITTPPGYVATAQLMIEPAKQQLLWHDSNMVDLTVDNAQVESQVEILRSERIANDVINSLGLADDPAFRSGAASSDYERHRIALGRFKSALTTRRVGQSYVIEISSVSTDPEKAARIANAITEAYIRDQLRAKTEVAGQASRWMQERVTELGVELNAAAAAVQKFRSENGITDNGNNNQSRLLDKLTELEARAQAYRKLYESFVQKLTENRQEESYPVSNARVIAVASTPFVKSYPKTSLIMLLALVLGLFAGAGVAAARSMLDGSVRNGRQIRDAVGLDCLSVLPRLRNTGTGGNSSYRQVLKAPFSAFAEGMRSVKLSLQNGEDSEQRLRIGVVSLMRGEGKTMVAVSLAALFAKSGRMTLLIDGDFRNPSLSRCLAPTAKWGLIEALESDVEGAVAFEPETMAHILPVVNSEQVADSADLLGSPGMRRLLERLDDGFSTILVDLPALDSAVDARAIGPLLDGCILVVEWGRAPVERLAEVIAVLRAGRIRLLGAVLNKVDNRAPISFARLAAGVRLRGAARYNAQPIEAD